MVLVKVVQLVIGIYRSLDGLLNMYVQRAVIPDRPTVIIIVGHTSDEIRVSEKYYARCEEEDREDEGRQGSRAVRGHWFKCRMDLLLEPTSLELVDPLLDSDKIFLSRLRAIVLAIVIVS